MNIFYLDTSPQRAAMALHDRHVHKMILEASQCLDSSIRPYLNDLRPGHPGNVVIKVPIQHRDHPVIRSVASVEGWCWTASWYCALLEEFFYRTGKQHAYADKDYQKALSANFELVRSRLPWRPIHLAVPEDILNQFDQDRHVFHVRDAVPIYRAYYARDKLKNVAGHVNTWTRRPPPQWLREATAGRGMIPRLSEDGRKLYFAERAEA